MTTFSWDNYLDLIVYPDGTVQKDDILLPDVQDDVDRTLQDLLNTLSKYPEGSFNEEALSAMNRIRKILFDTEENQDDYEEYEY